MIAATAGASPLSGFNEISTVTGLVVAIIAAVTFIFKVAQDGHELRRRQAESARVLVRDIYDTPLSMAALNMLDYASLTYRDEARRRDLFLKQRDVIWGLRCEDVKELSTNDIFVRDAFDLLFLKLEQVVSLLRVRSLRWTDVSAVLGYYVFLVRRDPELSKAVTTYGKVYGFPSVAALIEDQSRYQVDEFRGADDVMGEHRPPERSANGWSEQ
ncbi:MAG TPA: hypothetical protein VFB22_05070 [Candidatus Baltobacteraceae bacterium]|nr:hypothetical protein [Candidatus Baltobacteraceae bacterium]